MELKSVAHQNTGPEKVACKTQLRGTQAAPSRAVKEQQKGNSPNHVQAIFFTSVVCPDLLGFCLSCLANINFGPSK